AAPAESDERQRPRRQPRRRPAGTHRLRRWPHRHRQTAVCARAWRGRQQPPPVPPAALEPGLGPVPRGRRRGRAGELARSRRGSLRQPVLGAADPGAGAVDARPPRRGGAVVRRRRAHRAYALERRGQPAGAAAGLARGGPRDAGRSRRRMAGSAAGLALSRVAASGGHAVSSGFLRLTDSAMKWTLACLVALLPAAFSCAAQVPMPGDDGMDAGQAARLQATQAAVGSWYARVADALAASGKARDLAFAATLLEGAGQDAA